jgi:hypothetical protein
MLLLLALLLDGTTTAGEPEDEVRLANPVEGDIIPE